MVTAVLVPSLFRFLAKMVPSECLNLPVPPVILPAKVVGEVECRWKYMKPPLVSNDTLIFTAWVVGSKKPLSVSKPILWCAWRSTSAWPKCVWEKLTLFSSTEVNFKVCVVVCELARAGRTNAPAPSTPATATAAMDVRVFMAPPGHRNQPTGRFGRIIAPSATSGQAHKTTSSRGVTASRESRGVHKIDAAQRSCAAPVARAPVGAQDQPGPAILCSSRR